MNEAVNRRSNARIEHVRNGSSATAIARPEAARKIPSSSLSTNSDPLTASRRQCVRSCNPSGLPAQRGGLAVRFASCLTASAPDRLEMGSMRTEHARARMPGLIGTSGLPGTPQARDPRQIDTPSVCKSKPSTHKAYVRWRRRIRRDDPFLFGYHALVTCTPSYNLPRTKPMRLSGSPYFTCTRPHFTLLISRRGSGLGE